MDQIDTRLYFYLTTNKIYVKDYLIVTLGNYMSDTCEYIYEKKYRHLRDVLVPLCLDSHVRYYLNILRIIILLYNLYIEHEIYYMPYHKIRNCLNVNIFIENSMSKWNDLLHLMKKRGKWDSDYM